MSHYWWKQPKLKKSLQRSCYKWRNMAEIQFFEAMEAALDADKSTFAICWCCVIGPDLLLRLFESAGSVLRKIDDA